MRIGIRAHDCKKTTFEELIANMNKDGFYCTQLALKKAIHEFPVDRGAMTPGMALYMKRLFAENQVDVAVLGCYLNLANPDPIQLAEITEIYKAHLRFASLLGCGVVGTETGAVNTVYEFEPANHSEEALAIFIKNLRPIVNYAEKLGVIFAIEPVYSHIVYNNTRARKVLDEINSPNLQIIFDPVNVLSMDNYKDQDNIVDEAFELFGSEIAVIHAKDYVMEDGNLKSVGAGTGEFNYAPLMKHIKAKKPYIHVLLEDTNPENALQCKAYIEEKYRQA